MSSTAQTETPFGSLMGSLGHRTGFTITVPARCELGDRTEVHVQVGTQLVNVSEPATFGGGGGPTAPTPGQCALAALGSCEAITFRYFSEKLGIAIDTLVVEVRGDIDLGGLIGLAECARPGYSEVRMTVKVSGPEPIERYDELRRAVDEHCPMLEVFVDEVPVESEIELVDAQAEAA